MKVCCRRAAAAFVALQWLLVFYGGLLADARRARADEQPFRIGLNVWPGSAALTFAHEGVFKKGKKVDLFAEQGLKEGKHFEFLHHDNYPAMVEAFIAGKINVTQISIYDAVEAIARGKEFTAFAVPVDNKGYDLLVASKKLARGLPQGKEPSVKDLKGRTVAFAKGSIGEFVVRKLLATTGLRLEDVKPVPMQHLAAWCAVQQGRVDAGIVIYPFWEQGYPQLASTEQYALPNLWVIDAETLRARPDLPSKLIALWEETWRVVNDQQATFGEYMVKKFRFAERASCWRAPAQLLRGRAAAAANERVVGELRGRVPLLSLRDTSASYWARESKEGIWNKAWEIAAFLLEREASPERRSRLKALKERPERWFDEKWLLQQHYLRRPQRREPMLAADLEPSAGREREPAQGLGSWLDRWDGRRGLIALACCTLVPLALVGGFVVFLRRRVGWPWPPLFLAAVIVLGGAILGSAAIYARGFSTLRFVILVWQNEEETERELGPVRALLEEQLGRPVQLRIVGLSETEPMLRTASFDLFSLTAGVFVKLSNVNALRYLGRFAFLNPGQTAPTYTYDSAIVARRDRGIRSFGDLVGKDVAYVDHRSSSGYIIPNHFFTHLRRYAAKYPEIRARHFGGRPVKEIPRDLERRFRHRIFSGRHRISSEMLKEGQVDAIATVGAWARDRKRFNEEEFVVVGEIPIEIPTQILAARNDLPSALLEEISDALKGGLPRISAGTKRTMVAFEGAKLTAATRAKVVGDEAFANLKRIAGAPETGVQDVWVLETDSRIRITERVRKRSSEVRVAKKESELKGKPVQILIEWKVTRFAPGGRAEVKVRGNLPRVCADPLLEIFSQVTRSSRCQPPACGWRCAKKSAELECTVSRKKDAALVDAVQWFVDYWHLNSETPVPFARKGKFLAAVGKLPASPDEALVSALLGPSPTECAMVERLPPDFKEAKKRRGSDLQLVIYADRDRPPISFTREDISRLSVVSPATHGTQPPATAGRRPWVWALGLFGSLAALGLLFTVGRRLLPRRGVGPEPGFKPIRNVYIVGNPVKSRDMFFGREEEFHQIGEWIIHSGPKVILLKGGRRSGKTSILFQIDNGRLGEEVGVPVFLDFHSIAPRLRKDEDVAARIIEVILSAEALKGIEMVAADNPCDQLLSTVDRCLKHISPRPLVLLGDEVEALESLLADGTLHERAFQWLRPLFDRTVFFVVTSSRQFGAHLGPVLNSITQIKDISLFTFEDAAALIQRPLAEHLHYERKVVDSIFRLSGGQPFFVQYICQTLVQQINFRHKRSCVFESDLTGVIDFVVRNPHGHLHETWRALDPPVRATLAALANTLRDQQHFAGEAEILKMMSERRFTGDAGSVHEALAAVMQNTHLLERKANRHRFRCDLLRHWIRHSYQTGEDLDER